MRFLLDANMPRSAAAAIIAAGHECDRVAEILGNATDDEVAAYAREHGRVLMTRDFDFADERRFPPSSYAGIVVLSLPETASASLIASLVTALVQEPERLATLSGRLAIVEVGRVRLRPKPT